MKAQGFYSRLARSCLRELRAGGPGTIAELCDRMGLAGEHVTYEQVRVALRRLARNRLAQAEPAPRRGIPVRWKLAERPPGGEQNGP